MKIKLTAPDSVDIRLSADEAEWACTSENGISLHSLCESGVMSFIREILEALCGLKRDGSTVTAECLPYRSGSCLLRLRFTDIPGSRLYIFNEADDMLDALSKLGFDKYFNTSKVDIHPVGNKFFMYIPCTVRLTRHELALLNEYCA